MKLLLICPYTNQQQKEYLHNLNTTYDKLYVSINLPNLNELNTLYYQDGTIPKELEKYYTNKHYYMYYISVIFWDIAKLMIETDYDYWFWLEHDVDFKKEVDYCINKCIEEFECTKPDIYGIPMNFLPNKSSNYYNGVGFYRKDYYLIHKHKITLRKSFDAEILQTNALKSSYMNWERISKPNPNTLINHKYLKPKCKNIRTTGLTHVTQVKHGNTNTKYLI